MSNIGGGESLIKPRVEIWTLKRNNEQLGYLIRQL